MRSSRWALGGGARGQRGIGLVEVVVASGLMGVALVVLLSNLSTVVIGGRVAERRIVEERIARNQMERLFQASLSSCPSPYPELPVDGITYKITISCPPTSNPHYVEYKVRVADGSDGSITLVNDRWKQ
jgi:type II secretory pathway pseudopilin PulG